MNTNHLIYSFFALFIAGFWSILFAAFRETGNAGISRLVDKRPDAKARLEHWAPKWNLLRTTLRFSLTLFEIAAVAFALSTFPLSHPLHWAGLLLVMTLLYMVFIRVIPFVLAESYADRLSLSFLPLVTGITHLLTPLVWPVYAMERGLLARALSSSDEEDRPSAEEEIMTLVDQTDTDELEEEERDIIRSVFEFGETVVREIMTPRVDIEGLKDEATIDECIDKVKHSRHSRFPIYLWVLKRNTARFYTQITRVESCLDLTHNQNDGNYNYSDFFINFFFLVISRIKRTVNCTVFQH